MIIHVSIVCSSCNIYVKSFQIEIDGRAAGTKKALHGVRVINFPFFGINLFIYGTATHYRTYEY